MNMKFKHINHENVILEYELGKIVCVGRNYLDHIKELNNDRPDDPVLFIKPSTSVIACGDSIKIPENLGELHHEVELAVLITESLSNISLEFAKEANYYFGISIDLTLRDLQKKLKENGLPWEKAKAFDGSCVLSPWRNDLTLTEIYDAQIFLKINGEIKQATHIKNMITSIPNLISYISQFFTLCPGDVVLTGTPKGVGKLSKNDQVIIGLNEMKYEVFVKG